MDFFWILFAHYISDAALQPSWMLIAKKANWYVMMEHCFIWTGGIAIAFSMLGQYADWKLPILFFTHFLTDEWKVQFAPDPLDKRYLYIDQALHVLVLFILYSL